MVLHVLPSSAMVQPWSYPSIHHRTIVLISCILLNLIFQFNLYSIYRARIPYVSNRHLYHSQHGHNFSHFDINHKSSIEPFGILLDTQ
ncbi:hypothetical protein F383_18944 [Gossypium arboreum]|uniref:Uncharacterized protein n=1 Tax=Gossypium arboreum TaxID=29729 RepID=A0A0B0NI78_GOSAR|nr:hypothetical protein F383_18944 [Gossypium arboreum]